MTDQFTRTSEDIAAFLAVHYDRLISRVDSAYRHIANDALHEVVRKLWVRFDRGESVFIVNLMGYFRKSIWREVARFYGGGHRGKDVSYEPDLHDEFIGSVPSPEDWLLRDASERDEEQQIDERLSLLTDKEREVFKRVTLGKRQRDVATSMGVCQQQVSKYYTRAKKKLGVYQKRVVKMMELASTS